MGLSNLVIFGVIFGGVVFVLVVVALLVSWQKTQGARASGLWPPEGQTPTMEDVKRLVEAKQKILAIKMYREIKGVGLKEAKDAVDAMAS